jgi:serine/threonine-protein kinase
MQLNRLGPYEIGEPLGKGGMGSVFEAIDSQTGQQVAIKALTPHLAMAEGFRERFEAEIESLKTLRHEGIVRLFGYGEQDGVLFYSMELVEGVSLEDELKAGRRFTWREVTSIAIQLSLALKHAHDHGIVHRDIKPANILLYDDDRVKLADFGIARLFGTTQLTTAGGVLGTADYMSPEQADGRPVTARCDQYSLGGVMYALLAGRPPFLARNLPQMLQLQRFAKPEPVRRYASDTPEQLERVITQLLAKNPADRFPNMQVLARHLQAMVNALSRPAPDDFALSGEPHALDGAEDENNQVSAADVTQLELEPPPKPPGVSPEPAAGGAPRLTRTQDAVTMDADELMVSRSLGGAPSASPRPAAGMKARPPIERPDRFITVEEEEVRRRAEAQRSWIVVAVQLAALATVLTGMAAVAMYLSRPPSADELYRTIKSRGVAADDAALANTEREIGEFLQRYANDPRAAEVAQYHQEIALDKAERKLQREARGGEFVPSQLPVERLYLQLVNRATTDPEHAIDKLQSLIDLYAVNVAETPDADTTKRTKPARGNPSDHERIAIVVRLAERKVGQLRKEVAKQREAQLAEIRDRIADAAAVSASDPQQAAAMYRAVIDLYEHEPWAAEVVSAARGRLEKLGTTSHE